MNKFEMRQEHKTVLGSAEAILAVAEKAGRDITATEKASFDVHMARASDLAGQLHTLELSGSLSAQVKSRGPQILVSSPGSDRSYNPHAPSEHANSDPRFGAPGEHPKASEFRRNFGAWMNNGLSLLGGGMPQMEATATGPISIGTTGGWDSIGITVPTEILPHLPSYFALDSFGAAGATQIFTDHTRPLVKPIMSAGAADSTFAENAAPATSQPFGLSSFTFGGTKYGRLVLASYEALMNSELPLQGSILDELLASLATTLTAATTTSLYAALSAASGTLEVAASGSGGSVYTSMIDLRHAVPPRFDTPANKWMLSRATLATIRNTRASTSGVPMFDPNSDTIFARPYVLNDNFDTAAAGLVVYGSWADGCYLRRTPVQTRVLLELYAQSGQIGYRTQQWADQHFLAELVGAAQPPSFQPLYYTSLVSET